MRSNRFAFLFLSIALVLFAARASAGPLIHYQGVALDSSGAPLNAATEVRFNLYDRPTGGASLWTETHEVTPVDGVFSVLLGSVHPIEPGDFDSGDRWLELVVGGETLTPRQAIASVPRALNADRLQGLSVDDLDSGQAAVHVPRNNETALLESGSIAVEHVSMAIGVDNLPIIAYHDSSAGSLNVLHCSSHDCSTADAPSVVDAPSGIDVGEHASIAIGGDGLPLIAYVDSTTPGVKLAHCIDIACMHADIRALNMPSALLSDVALTIGVSGYPVVVAVNSGDPWIGYCNDASCQHMTTSVVNDFIGDTRSVDVTINPEGQPVVVFDDYHGFHIARCPAAAGSCQPSLSETTVASNTNGTYYGPSVTIGNDGMPIASYVQEDQGWLLVTHCTNVTCTNHTTESLTPADGPIDEGQTSLSIGYDGLPVIAYYDDLTEQLKLVKCKGLACDSSILGSVVTVDPSTDTGRFNSMTMGTDGRPLIAYVDRTTG